ncbi:hypothetical protein [Modestobacter excelsi]|nr:hypothetical protein [Modestobacter excelsi]
MPFDAARARLALARAVAPDDRLGVRNRAEATAHAVRRGQPGGLLPG